MKKYKIFFDTNTIRNKELNTFFGNQDKLEALSKKVDICIPHIVYSEITSQKRKFYIEEKLKLTKNKLYNFFVGDKSINFDIEDKIMELEKNINFDFELVPLYNKDILDDLINLALEKEPPFETSDGNDKGFKDACIFFTIVQYKETINKKVDVYCCTKDGRLKEALKKKGFTTIDDIQKVESYIANKYKTPYFINRIKEELHNFIKYDNYLMEDSIKDMFLNINENDVILLKTEEDDEEFFIEIESKEILSYIRASEINKYIDDFRQANDHEKMFSAVQNLRNSINFINSNQLESILHTMAINPYFTDNINKIEFLQFFDEILPYVYRCKIDTTDIDYIINRYQIAY